MQGLSQNAGEGEKSVDGQLFFFESILKNDNLNIYIGSNPGGRLKKSIIEANNSIRIASPYLDSDTVDLLRDKYLGGLENISIITTAEEKMSNNVHIKGLKKIILCKKQKNMDKDEYCPIFDKVTIFKGNFFHVKFYIIDDEIVYIGSMNFTTKGMGKNIESNITFKDTNCVKEFIEYFERLLSPDFDKYKWNNSKLGELIYKNIFYFKYLFRALVKKYNINTNGNDNYNKVSLSISKELKNHFSCNDIDIQEDGSFKYKAEITKEMYEWGLENIRLS